MAPRCLVGQRWDPFLVHSRRVTCQRNGHTSHMRIGGSITYPVRDTSTLAPATRRPRR